MKTFYVLALFVVMCSFTNWETNFDKAKQTAKAEHKFVLLNFSGSDWCGPCIKLHNEYFGTAAFQSFAAKKLVLVNADFPRQKKNQLPKELQKQNEHLADQYNANGAFPLTVLINQDGKVLKSWDGVPKEDINTFISDIQSITADQQ